MSAVSGLTCVDGVQRVLSHAMIETDANDALDVVDADFGSPIQCNNRLRRPTRDDISTQSFNP